MKTMWKCKKCDYIIERGSSFVKNMGKCPKCGEHMALERYDPLNDPDKKLRKKLPKQKPPFFCYNCKSKIIFDKNPKRDQMPICQGCEDELDEVSYWELYYKWKYEQLRS
jgi:hypothetical protein